jgi:hypothetical protein
MYRVDQMHGTYEQNKASIIRWQNKNKDHFRAINRKSAKTSYKKKCYYSFEIISKSFRKIEMNYFV